MKTKGKLSIEYVKDVVVLKEADYNARDATDDQIAGICRSIVEHDIIDPIIARREDGLILGGHQRKKAIVRLLSGPFKYKGKDGKPVVVNWKMPEEGLPVIFLEGVTDQKAKLINLALNRASGDWEHDRLASLLKSLSNDGLDLHELGATAFTPAEITDYLDIADEKLELSDDDDGKIPAPSQQAPKLSLDFASKELRDAVKVAIGEAAKKDEPSGDTLARMLGVKAPRKLKKVGT